MEIIMKVGILSMQRIINFGSFLQAFALKSIVEELGGDVYFIDIEKGVSVKYLKHSVVKINKFNKIIKSIINLNIHHLILCYLYNKKREKKFTKVFFPILGINKKYSREFDLVIIGSDEVFNACQDSSFGFTPQLFGKGIPAKKVISYAGSFGFTTMDDIIKNDIYDSIKEALGSFSSISVRDNNSFDIIKSLTTVAPKIHLDPVLIYNWDKYQKSTPLKKKYIIIYTYHNRITSAEKEAIIKMARSQKKEIISINTYYAWCDSSILPKSPFDIFDYFRNASDVVTDTFHGTIFSIVSKSNYCTIIRDSNKNKLEFLLNFLKQSDRQVQNANEIELRLATSPDYIETDQILSVHRKETMNYLIQHMNSDRL